MNSSSPSRPNAGRPSEPLPEPSVIPTNGWHCGHYFYRFCRERMTGKFSEELREQLKNAIHPSAEQAPELSLIHI